jgi:hypothetical protein
MTITPAAPPYANNRYMWRPAFKERDTTDTQSRVRSSPHRSGLDIDREDVITIANHFVFVGPTAPLRRWSATRSWSNHRPGAVLVASAICSVRSEEVRYLRPGEKTGSDTSTVLIGAKVTSLDRRG